MGNRTVAFLDVLGFKSMIDNVPLSDLSKKYMYLSIAVDSLVKPLEFKDKPISMFPNHPSDEPWCIKHIFSDSIILVSKDDSLESALKLMMYVWRLAKLLIGYEMPARGGISFGEFYINQNLNIFLGKALTEAYLLESKQNWIGISLDHKLLEAFPSLKQQMKEENSLLNILFPEYEVPIKKSSPEKYHVVNWRFNLVSQNGTRSLFKGDGTKSVEMKIANTLEFAKEIIKSGKVYGSDKVPVEASAFYIGEKEPPFPHGDEL